MRTAESYIGNWKEIKGVDGKSHRMILVEHAIVALNEARIEAIKACIEIAHEQGILGSAEYIEPNMKKLLNQVK